MRIILHMSIIVKVNARGMDNKTALILATQKQETELVRMLLDYGAQSRLNR